jgi:hypothetical protein
MHPELKKELKLIAWYLLCPIYIPLFIYWILLFLVGIGLLALNLTYIAENILYPIANYPFDLLDKLKE